MLTAALLHPKDGLAARDLGGLGYFVVRVIRKQRVIGIFSSCAQAAIAGNEQPMIRVTDNAHKKWTKRIAVRYFEIRVSTYLGILQFHKSGLSVDLLINRFFEIWQPYGSINLPL